MKRPAVVVVVVSWNGLCDTIHCLTSLRRLAYENYRTVLVDNDSQDGTSEVIRCYFPEVALITNRHNTGYVHANNQGVAWALEQGAEWILLLNNDVQVRPDLLDRLVGVGHSQPDVGVVGPVMQRTLRPDFLDLGGDLDFRLGRVLLRRYEEEMAGRSWGEIDYVWGCTLMARRQIFEACGGLDPVYVAYFEDADLCLRARRLGYRTAVALKARVVHQVGRSGEKRFAWQTYYRIRNHALFFTRYARRRDWPTLLPSLFLFQLPMLLVRSARVYLARKVRRRKYAHRPISLWGYERDIQPPNAAQIQEWLHEAGYSAS
jgi:GT2 family glycosyltransferase